MFPIERDKIVRSSQFAYPFRWKLMTSSNFIDIVWCSCTIKINRLKRRKRQIWKWFLLNSCFTFSGGLSEHFHWEFLDFDSNRTYFGSAIVSCPTEKELSKFAICGPTEFKYWIIWISFDFRMFTILARVRRYLWYLGGKLIFQFKGWWTNDLKYCW